MDIKDDGQKAKPIHKYKSYLSLKLSFFLKINDLCLTSDFFRRKNKQFPVFFPQQNKNVVPCFFFFFVSRFIKGTFKSLHIFYKYFISTFVKYKL